MFKIYDKVYRLQLRILTALVCVSSSILASPNQALILMSSGIEAKIDKAMNSALEQYDFETNLHQYANPTELKEQIQAYADQYATNDLDQKGYLLILLIGESIMEHEKAYLIGSRSGANPDQGRLSLDQLRQVINDIPCQHIFLLLDTPYGETFSPSWGMRGTDPFRRPGELEITDQLIKNQESYTSKLFLTRSILSMRNEKPGNFIEQLLSVLHKQGGHDGVLTFGELIFSLKTQVEGLIEGSFGNHQWGGNFLFVHKNHRATSSGTAFTQTMREQEYLIWSRAKKAHRLQRYQDYINQYPMGNYVKDAKQQLSILMEENEWKLALSSRSAEGFRSYLKKFPNGQYAPEASRRLKLLETTPSTPTKEQQVILDHQGNSYTYQVMRDGKYWLTQNLALALEGSYLHKDPSINSDQYGRFYSLEAASKACPQLGEDWRLPTAEDWRELIAFYSISTSHEPREWLPNGPIENIIPSGLSHPSIGFVSSLAGFRTMDGKYLRLNKLAYYWSVSWENGFYQYFYWRKDDDLWRQRVNDADVGFSVRCVKDHSK